MTAARIRIQFPIAVSSHQPSAVSHKPSAISHQPSTISHQPSAISQFRFPAISRQPSAISRQPSANFGSQPSAVGRQLSAISHHPSAITISCLECNRRHSYLCRSDRLSGVRCIRESLCASGLRYPELRAQVRRANSCTSYNPAHMDASRTGRNG